MSRRVLSPADIDKLEKLLNMFASEYVGERAAAALMAHKMIHSLGLTWRDLLAPAQTEPKRVEAWQGWRLEVLACQGALTDWERSFARDIGELDKLSPKQAQTLSRLLQKCRAFNARRAAWAM
jgi:hypothetical protein